MASSSVCASTTCVVECSTSVLKKRLIGLRFTPDLGVCLNVYQDRVGKSQLLVLYNVIINYSIRFYPFSNPAVPLKFRVGPLFRMFSFQTVPWMTCHRIGCRVSFFHNQESPRHTHTHWLQFATFHSSNPKGWLTFAWNFFFPGKWFEIFSRVLGNESANLLLRQSNRPYIGSSTSLLWSTLDPGTLVCDRTGAQMLLWMDVATMMTRVIIAIIRTMMIHSWSKWWGKHLEIFSVYRSSHSIAKIPRCRCHLK